VPTYEYRCKSCGSHLEVVQAFTDDSLTTCEACGGPLRKIFGSVGISFKGSGFYKNDSRNGSKVSAGAGSGESASADSSSSADTSSGSDAGSSTSEAGAKKPEKADKAKPDKAAKPAASASSSTKST
jgi:putative FmdB family regulatory protein